MALTTLLRKLKRVPEPESESYFAIQIDGEFVKTAVWTVRNQSTDIIALGSTSEWDGSSTQILVEAIDGSLSIALEQIEEKPEPVKVIFGLQETWVTPDGVAHPRLADLKTICEKLGLKPLGFVVTTEAICQYLRTTEGTPPTAILLRVSASEVAVAIVNLGHIEGTHVAGRSGDLAADVREGLARFGERESFPSRILLYNGGEDLQELTQQLLSYDWQAELTFLHIPKIEPLDDTFSIKAIAVAGGSEVAKSLGFTIIEMPVSDTTEKAPIVAEPLPEPDATEEATPVEPTAEPEPAPVVEEIAGFGRGAKALVSLITRIKQFRPSIPSVSIPFSSRRLIWTVGFVMLLLLLPFFGLIQAAKRLPTASITIAIEGKTISERLAISIDEHAERTDLQRAILPAQAAMLKKSGNVSQATTGAKVVGEKAAGTVKLYNKTNAVKTFPSGTMVTASDGKKFVLDTDTTVASQSAQDAGITFGVASASVTASAFGPEYNLDAGTLFEVSNLSPSAFSAKNESAFSGGTKSEIQAASKNDHDSLVRRATDELREQAKSDIESQSNGRRVFTETIAVDLTDTAFSAEVGEEAGDLSLAYQADITALSIDDGEFRSLIAALLAPNVPEGFRLLPERLEPVIDDVSENDEGLNISVVIDAPLSPVIDEDMLKARIAGKRPAVAAEEMKTFPFVHKIEMTLSPSFPPILRWIPVSHDRMKLNVVVE